jgi:hypothetical protein
MSVRFQTLALWLWIINAGVVVGAGLYESRIEFPQWLSVVPSGRWVWNAEAARNANTGLRFWVYVSTGPLTLITLLNLVVALRSSGPARPIWLAGIALGLLERVFTFTYFIPQMLELMSGDLAQAEAVALAQRWHSLNYVRHALLVATWGAALKAFALFYTSRGRDTPVASA